MTALRKTEEVRRHLEQMPEIVSVDEVRIEKNMIQSIAIQSRAMGRVTVRKLDVNDAPELFTFYTEGLSEIAKILFAPYPLFHIPPRSADELASRIADWKKETDWMAVNILKASQIIGFCMLKRFYSDQVTSGIAVRDEFLKKGLGYLLQKIVMEQARLLNLKRFHVKIVSDNVASIKLHEKCGFKQSRILGPPLYEEMLNVLRNRDVKHHRKEVDRRIIEMVVSLEQTKTV
jgi:RimJ/RimL family protein N-acetyltransferase